MKPFKRADRVSGQVQKALSDLLLKDIKDPRLKNVTITGVKMSPDLRLARIYFAIPASTKEKPEEDAIKGFNSALGYIKRTLARQLGLRYMPDLKFHYDQSFDYGARIDSVLNTLKIDHASDNKST